MRTRRKIRLLIVLYVYEYDAISRSKVTVKKAIAKEGLVERDIIQELYEEYNVKEIKYKRLLDTPSVEPSLYFKDKIMTNTNIYTTRKYAYIASLKHRNITRNVIHLMIK